MKLRWLSLALAASLLLVACGSSGGGDDAGPTTTDTSATTTTGADGPTTSDPTAVVTTVVKIVGPAGDEKLIPHLMQPADFGSGLKYEGTENQPFSADVCPQAKVTTKWTASATMTVISNGASTQTSGGETILLFKTGQAAPFMSELNAAIAKCGLDGAAGAPKAVLAVVPNVGDLAYRLSVVGAAPTSEPRPSTDLVFARVGDQVLVVSSYALQTLLTPAVLAKAVDRAKG